MQAHATLSEPQGGELELLWMPGHRSISGNVKADRTADQAHEWIEDTNRKAEPATGCALMKGILHPDGKDC